MDIIVQAEVREAHVARGKAVLHDASRTSARPIISTEDSQPCIN